MTKNGYSLVWGGSDTGLMKLVATEIQDGGGKLYGVSIEEFRSEVRKNADEIVIAKSLGERKATMLEKGDAVVALVGGLGTFDEIMDIVELKRQKSHNKPVVILNTDNFYGGFRRQFSRMQREGFNIFSLEDFVYFAQTPQEAIDYINKHLE